MKVTLIFPSLNMNGFDSQGKAKTHDSEYINHGLAYISANAKKHGHEVDLIDLRTLKGWEHFEEEIKKRKSRVYGISSMTNDFEHAKICFNIIKSIDNDVITVLGGVHASINTDDVLKFQNIDYVITGEGEISFVELLKDLEQGQTPEKLIAGISPDLDEIPWSDRDLFDIEKELNHPFMPYLPTPFVSILIARGCPYKCTFCQPADRTVFGGKVRRRSVANAIDELKYLKDRFDFKSLMVHDDLFTINKKWVLEFCDEYEKAGLPNDIVCQMRADHVHKKEEMTKRLNDIGVKSLIIGFESGSQRILDFLKKSTTVEDNYKAAEICHKYGIKIFANIMFGIPTETNEEAFLTAKMAQDIKAFHLSPTFFTPYIGSDLYDFVIENNYLIENLNYEDYDRCAARSKGHIKGIDYNFLKELLFHLERQIPLTDIKSINSFKSKFKKGLNFAAEMAYKNEQIKKISKNQSLKKLANYILK